MGDASVKYNALQEGTMPKTPYDNWKAITHAKEWCGKKSNVCGVFLDGENKSDCAHFIAHCLAAGGIVIKNTDRGTAFCPHGLAVRNVDVVGHLKQLAAAFDNVKPIDMTDAIVGDVGFLKLERPRHAFMVCEPWNGSVTTTPKVYAHSSSRCCEVMDTSWRHWLSDAFRLEDS
jgi:hypothetical protein